MQINTYTHELSNKYLTIEEKSKILINAQTIRSDIDYLDAHANRTCKSSFTFIPRRINLYYGDGRLLRIVMKILGSQDCWTRSEYDNTDKEMFNYSIAGIDTAFSINSNILFKIFNHEEKDEINIEFIPDFIQWTDFLLKIYSDIIKSRDELFDICYSDSQRYCKKTENFYKELDKLLNNR